MEYITTKFQSDYVVYIQLHTITYNNKGDNCEPIYH
jgi:hypothetical protein